MSGSPIVQNGQLVGALTNVFLNDPEKGYAVFSEEMYDELIDSTSSINRASWFCTKLPREIIPKYTKKVLVKNGYLW